MNHGLVSSGRCHSRAPDVAFKVVPTATRQKIWSCTYVRVGSRTRTTSASCSLAANRLGQNGETVLWLLGGNLLDRNVSCSSIGSQPAWTEQPKEVLLIGRGLANCKIEVTTFCLTVYGRNRVLFIGSGVWRTPKWMKQSYLRPPTVETGSS